MKTHILRSFDDIIAKRHEKYPFHDKTGNIENFFKQWSSKNIKPVGLQEADVIYAPIRFVDFFKVHVPGDATPKRSRLKFIYDRLYTPHFLANSERYFVVCQWSHGTCMDLKKCIKFQSSAYSATEISIPLCVDPHPNLRLEKQHLASFVGNLFTHPIRGKITKLFSKNDKIIVRNALTDLRTFRRSMRSSWFALCPRGFGPSSFRIFEALQMGTIPVIISDSYFFPYADEVDWNEFSIRIPESSIGKIEEKISSYSLRQRREMIATGRKFFADYCTKPAVCKRIMRKVEKLCL